MDLEYGLIIPEFVLAILATLVVAGALVFKQVRQEVWGYATAGALLVMAILTAIFYWDTYDDFANVLAIDHFTVLFRVFFLGIALFTVLASIQFAGERLKNHGEFYGLILFATLGMMLLAAARELLTAYLALELLSFSFYILVGFNKLNPFSNEASLKYMLLGAFSSALMLYGISLIYGVTGTTTYSAIDPDGAGVRSIAGQLANFSGLGNDPSLPDPDATRPGLLIGLIMITAGLGLQDLGGAVPPVDPGCVSGRPTADDRVPERRRQGGGVRRLPAAVQRGLPAGGGGVVVVRGDHCRGNDDHRQPDGAAANQPQATDGLLVDLAGGLSVNRDRGAQRDDDRSIAGRGGGAGAAPDRLRGDQPRGLHGDHRVLQPHRSRRHRGCAGPGDASAVPRVRAGGGLFSLAGMPLFAGFATKFIVFQVAFSNGFLWLGAIGVTASFVSLYYYLMVIKQMYLYEPEGPDRSRFAVPRPMALAIAVLVAGVFFLGLYPTPLFEVINNSVAGLFEQAIQTSATALK